MFDCLYANLNVNNNQPGFRPGDSTINQLLSIVHTIFTAFDCNPTLDVRSVFLDISKAFDRVWHEGLIYKVQCYDIDDDLLKINRSFLANRKQRTVLSGKTSNWGLVTAGVPQGSVLGPLFFLVYMNDLTEDLRYNAKLFADDISFFTIVHNANAAASDMNHDIDIIKAWASKWRMSFNPDPNKHAVEVMFSTKRVKTDHPDILFEVFKW